MGVSLQHFRENQNLLEDPQLYRQRICEDFAVLLAQSWHFDVNSLPKGVVGKTLKARLQMLSDELPVRFLPVAKFLLRQLPVIESLPWVLTHGDLVASNILLDMSSGHLSGLVDWAEAEILPFGVCLYGLEELLGEMTPKGFSYCPNANSIRDLFWTCLLKKVPELQYHLTAVSLARDLGVLLWHGIAFDEGKIDRVVQEGRDDEEIAYLDTFLDVSIERVMDLSLIQAEQVVDVVVARC